MDWIESATGVRHAVTERGNEYGTVFAWVGKTFCGRIIHSQHSGGCIAAAIDCGSCRRVMRKDGWLV